MIVGLHISTTDNAAFQELGEAAEIARILRAAADRVEVHGVGGSTVPLLDYNGNRVGEITYSGED